jgi:DNA ligase-1
MDPHEPVRDGSLSFVSHAHSDHTGQHSEVLFTEPTRRLMRSRISGERVEHVLAFGDEADSGRFGRPPGSFRIKLTPAGHILGSAMARIEAGGGSLLYTGDFKLRRGLSAEPCEPLPADVLVMETTYGRPHYRFPSTDEVVASVLRFCREALDNDEVPVLLGYSLGKSQEILCSLARAGLPVMLHSAVATLTRIYADLGFAFPDWSDWNPRKAAGHVLVAPPGGTAQDLRRRLPQARTATLTGWALDSGSRFRSGTDASFPMSDHADFPDLVEMVQRVAPKRIHTLHGFAAEFAAHLRGLGWDARPLGLEEQLELRLAEPPAFPTSESTVQDGQARIDTASPTSAPTPVAAPASLREVARVCAAIRAVASKQAKVAELAGFLRELPGEILPTVVRWMCGSATAGVGAPELKIGWKALQEGLCEAAGTDRARFHRLYLVHSDTGETAAALFEGRRTPHSDGWTLAGLRSRLDEFPALDSQKERTALLTDTFRRADAEEIRYLVKILTGNLRIGLKEGLVEEAVADAFDAAPEAVRRACMLLGDLGEASVLARDGRLHQAGLVPLRPVRLMLAVPEPDSLAVMGHAEGWARPDGAPVRLQVEDKYDGIR